ncbi:MAG: MBL fold metallo-hydrolase [Rickettsiales bacterium]|jgi:metallo-beta-lactamase family protein|nr:MBL fold metallo-hydrolase [Rickettsiales bacterium]
MEKNAHSNPPGEGFGNESGGAGPESLGPEEFSSDSGEPEITFLGATRTVTGSKYLVTFRNKRILIDCGLFQGLKEDRQKNREPLPLEPRDIDAVILTHAHLDHSGYIPLLVKNGFKGHVYCTRASYELSKIILPDSGYLQEEDAKFLTKKNVTEADGCVPLYTEEDAEKCLENFRVVRFGEGTQLSGDISFKIEQAGHILGAGIVSLSVGNRRVVFSGDLGRTDDDLLRDPMKIGEADYIVCESTYGDRNHGDSDQKEALAEIVNRTVARGGNIVIPAFAVGRTQLLLYYLHQLRRQQKISKIPIFVDSPMSIKVTNLLDDFASEHRLSERECLEIFDDTKFTTTVEQSKRIFNHQVPSVIISASGMATGGRILHHLAHYGPDNRNTIVLVGFQANGTRGRYLQDGKKELRIHGRNVRVAAEVVTLENMSAHADSDELMSWLGGFRNKPSKLFLVHGEEKSSLALADRVRNQLGWTVVVPHYGNVDKL